MTISSDDTILYEDFSHGQFAWGNMRSYNQKISDTINQVKNKLLDGYYNLFNGDDKIDYMLEQLEKIAQESFRQEKIFIKRLVSDRLNDSYSQIKINDYPDPFFYYTGNTINGTSLLDALPQIFYSTHLTKGQNPNEKEESLINARAFFKWITQTETIRAIINNFDDELGQSREFTSGIRKLFQDIVEGIIDEKISNSNELFNNQISPSLSFLEKDFEYLEKEFKKGQFIKTFLETHFGKRQKKKYYHDIQNVMNKVFSEEKPSTFFSKRMSARFSKFGAEDFIKHLKDLEKSGNLPEKLQGLFKNSSNTTLNKMDLRSALSYEEIFAVFKELQHYNGMTSQDTKFGSIVEISFSNMSPSKMIKDISKNVDFIIKKEKIRKQKYNQKKNKQTSSMKSEVETEMLIESFFSLLKKTLRNDADQGVNSSAYKFLCDYESFSKGHFKDIEGKVRNEILDLTKEFVKSNIFSIAIKELENSINGNIDKDILNQSIKDALEIIKERKGNSDKKQIANFIYKKLNNTDFSNIATQSAQGPLAQKYGSNSTYQTAIKELLKSSQDGLIRRISGSIGEILLTTFMQNMLKTNGIDLDSYLLGKARNDISEQLHADNAVLNKDPDVESQETIESYGMQSKFYTSEDDNFSLYRDKSVDISQKEVNRYFNEDEKESLYYLFLNEKIFSSLKILDQSEFNDIITQALYSRYKYFIRYADASLEGNKKIGDIKNIFFVINLKIIPTSLLMDYARINLLKTVLAFEKNQNNQQKNVKKGSSYDLNTLAWDRGSVPILDVGTTPVNVVVQEYQDVNSSNNLTRIENATIKMKFKGLIFKASEVLSNTQRYK